MAKNVEQISDRSGARSGLRRRIARHWAIAGLGLVSLLGWKALDDAASQRLFLINRSPSLPNWAFLMKRGKLPSRGDAVFFTPPAGPLVSRHFGDRPPAFGKIVYGMPGDDVEQEAAEVFIRSGSGHGTERGQRRHVATMKPRTLSGEPLEAGPTGMIPAGCYYVGSPHKDGFDSRYAAIGFVCRDRIIGTAEASVL